MISFSEKSKNTFRHWLLSLSALAVLVYIIGALKTDVMDIDSSHYAEMAREMHETGNYLVIKNRTVDDYLDKPPLIFWLSSLIYSIAGVSAFSFRIPAILASLLGAYSVYRFAKLYYDRDTGLLAALIMLSSQAYFLYNHNFLTDTLLANFTLFSIWQLAEFLERRRWPFFLGAFTGLALAMMSKGPLGLMVPVAGFSVHFIFKRQWRNFIRWEWLAGIFMILILLLPMMVGLYRQFGTIGLEFFFWTQSFGRITGQSHWHNPSSPFYFIHTFLWFILPWTILAVYALIRNIYKAVAPSKKSERLPEVISSGGFVLTFIALSLSKFKLPQYIFVLIPLAATFTAASVMHLLRKRTDSGIRNWLQGSGYFIAGIYWLAIAGILIFVFPENSLIAWVILCGGLSIFFFVMISNRYSGFRIVILLALTAIISNLILNRHFYPHLLYYQPGKRIAHHLEHTGINQDIYYYQYHSPALDFHLGEAPPVINQRKLERMAGRQEDFWIVTDQGGRENIRESVISREIEFKAYPVQALTLKFLNKDTREEVLKKHYLIRISGWDGR